MSPAAITQGVNASPTPAPQPATMPAPIPAPSPNLPNKHFDDIFHNKFMNIITKWKEEPQRGQLTQKERKAMIEKAYIETDEVYFGKRPLNAEELRMRCLTKVFYKVLAEEPWSEDWIRAPDVERKLSKFEMHPATLDLARAHNLNTPREAVRAAREHAIKAQEAYKEALKADPEGTKKDPPKIDAGPYDDIEIIYIAGTVSATATNRISRDNVYPVSVSSVAHTLQNHYCRDMVRPYTMAERFINCTDTKELEEMRQFACNVCDFAPHLLDNDNVSLLVVLLIMPRSDCCKRFENNGIRIEGSTISHRKAECMKNKMGWRTPEEKKPFDQFASEFQARVKSACFPPVTRMPRNNNGRKSLVKMLKSPSTPQFQVHHQPPQMGYMASPQVQGSPITGTPVGAQPFAAATPLGAPPSASATPLGAPPSASATPLGAPPTAPASVSTTPLPPSASATPVPPSASATPLPNEPADQKPQNKRSTPAPASEPSAKKQRVEDTPEAMDVD